MSRARTSDAAATAFVLTMVTPSAHIAGKKSLDFAAQDTPAGGYPPPVMVLVLGAVLMFRL